MKKLISTVLGHPELLFTNHGDQDTVVLPAQATRLLDTYVRFGS